MTRSFTYRSPTTPAGPGWTEDIPIRLGSIAGITQEAELAAVGVSQITIDDQGLFLSGDPGEGFADLSWSAGVGHAGDAIVGLKQFDWTDSAAPSGHRRIWTGYIQDRTYRRGSEGESPSLITGVDRVIDATLSDINSFLTFRVLGADETSAFDRPEETDVERITALLAVDFLSTTLFDGLVSTSNPVDMDAVNYADQTPAEVINDCVQQSGKNAFVIYDEAGDYGTAGDFVLFYDSNDSTAYPAAADFAVSNVLEDIDFDADRIMTGPVWGPTHDATLVRDPSRVFAGIKLRYAAGSVYVSNLDTSYAFGYRDIVMDAPNVKTEAKALARANRYLADLNSEDDRISLTLTLPNAHVNDWMAGQYAPCRFVHLPGYENSRNLRALSRTVSQDRLTPLFYQVHYECTPMIGQPMGAFAFYLPGIGWDGGQGPGIPYLSKPTTPGNLLVALMQVQANSSIHAFTNPPTMEDNPVVGSWTAGPYAGPDGWTILDYTEVWNSGQSAGPPGAVQVAVAVRLVAPGEVTQSPAAFGPGDRAGDSVSVWLWEFPTTVLPTLSGSINGTLGDVRSAPQTLTFATGLSGFVLSLVALTLVDYAGGMDVNVTTGTEIQQAQGDNNPTIPLGIYPTHIEIPQALIATADESGDVVASVEYRPNPSGHYTTLGYAGVAVEIPGASVVPGIPHPADQT